MRVLRQRQGAPIDLHVTAWSYTAKIAEVSKAVSV